MLTISLIAYIHVMHKNWANVLSYFITPENCTSKKEQVFIESTNESNKGTHLITADAYKFDCSSASVNAFYMYRRLGNFCH